MKMVSAAKYARAERELRQARPYGEGVKVHRNNNNIKYNYSFKLLRMLRVEKSYIYLMCKYYLFLGIF